MSAGINHELNQPLAAMRTYADNAPHLPGARNLDQAAWNLQQISELTGRMAQISGQLKVFSRKSSGQRIRLVACLPVWTGVRILRNRIEQADAELVTDLPPQDLFWLADMVQLEQVLVNLIGNACDVLVNQPNRTAYRVSARACADVVVLEVHDSGPHPAAEPRKGVRSFFTTTENGLDSVCRSPHTIAQQLGVADRQQRGAVRRCCVHLTWPPGRKRGGRRVRQGWTRRLTGADLLHQAEALHERPGHAGSLIMALKSPFLNFSLPIAKAVAHASHAEALSTHFIQSSRDARCPSRVFVRIVARRARIHRFPPRKTPRGWSSSLNPQVITELKPISGKPVAPPVRHSTRP